MEDPKSVFPTSFLKFTMPTMLAVPVTSGYFSRSRRAYLRVVLVVSVPAPNKSLVVAIKFSQVNSNG